MCGICGIAGTTEMPLESVIRKMCNTIVHRGPDGEGIYTAPGVGLGMRRLAIIDLLTGDQPMSNETGSVQVVLNGEIYNFRELRHNLMQKGHIFKTCSDTEVIPHLYAEFGIGFVEQLNGMFAIALWDQGKRRLLLIRDRVGIKPLFYSVKGDTLFFGSEIKCILAANGSDRTVDLRALDQFLTFEYSASPRTLFSDVRKLPPGGWLTWDRGKLREGRYWQFQDNKQQELDLTDNQWAERLKDILDSAVKRQMVSDVPIGCFLSGGIDSSIITSAMHRSSKETPKTFSIGFSDKTYNELKFARIMAKHCKTDHYEKLLNPDYLSLVEKIIFHMDQPIGDFSVFPTYLVSKIAREKVTVILSGDGGDELFAGYDTYVADRVARWTVDLLPNKAHALVPCLANYIPVTRAKKGLFNRLRFFLECAGLPPGWQHLRWMVFLTPDKKRELYREDMYEEVAHQTEEIVFEYLDGCDQDRLQQQLFCDARFYLAENILPKVDLMSMATSLETRVPYLDNEVVSFVNAMPSRLKWKGFRRKHVLKQAYSSELPSAIQARRKEGFSIPLKNWLQTTWNPLLHDLLSEHRLSRDGLLNPKTVSRWIRQHENNQAHHSHSLWSLMVFQLWKDRWMNRPSFSDERAGAAVRW
jgi:asparagine synthase (glutamine-hydrolysing)